MPSPLTDLDRFYDCLVRLAASPGQGRRLAECDGRTAWPDRGVYFFREPGEWRLHHLEVGRVVRVGTHAVSSGASSTLWRRLRGYRGTRNGGGNHRGSIFRLHVGAALLARDRIELSTWGNGGSAHRDVRQTERSHETRVSSHIGAMTVYWVKADDEPGPQSVRARIERNVIALLSNHLSPVDRPSKNWLGRHSTQHEIQRSGLWNLQHVDRDYDPAFLNELERLVSDTVSGPRP
jgi:hypothetical protein